jgi:exonuclease SbcC
MRPIRLKLEGFTSFVKPQELDFTSLDLFAITGPTGAGKTSILDAILYALYGATPRLGEREIGRLVSLGSVALKVSLEFETGGKRWRATRTRKRSVSELLLETQSGDEWEPVAGGVKEVNDRIRSVVGLDFAGFTRSVILPQGRFDEFLRGEPKQRTEILKDLLGLRVYDRMRELANTRHGELKSQADTKESTLNSMFAGVTEEKLAELKNALEQVQMLLGELEAAKSSVEELSKLALDLRDQRRAAQTVRAAIQEAESQLQTLAETMKSCESQMHSLESQLAANTFDEAQWTQLVQATPLMRQKQRCDEKLMLQRKEQRARAQEAVQREAAAKQASEHFERSAHDADTRKAEWQTAEKAWNSFRETHGSPDLIQGRLEDLDAAMRAVGANPEARLEELRQLVGQAEQTLEHVRQQHAANEIRRHLKDGETCPVCEQVIHKLPAVSAVAAVDAVRELVGKARSEYDAFKKRFDAWHSARAKAAGLTEELLQQGRALEAAARTAQKAHADAVEVLNQAQHAATIAKSALELIASQMAGLDREIRQTQDELRSVSAELAKYPDWAPLPLSELEASLEDQNAAKAKRDTLLQEKQRLQSAAAESEAKRLTLHATVQAKREEAERADRRMAELRSALQPHLESPMLGADEAEHFTAKLTGIGQQIKAANVGVGKAQAEIEQLEEKLRSVARMRNEIEQLRGEADSYRQLGYLLRADQFIAYSQREALERLAREASEQLSTLSSGNYTLTLSDDKNEFFVVDNWNGGEVRSAKTLSGGESFLASLALALALSQGLAGFGGEQSRSKLDSLFIDEGISSLDADSLEIAISALESLTAGNRMVGVISHIAELGERLNARVRVEKTATGSRIRVDSSPEARTANA